MKYAKIERKKVVPKLTWGGFASGAASGAATGSAFGPWGTAIGAIGGGIFGALSSSEAKKKEEEAAALEEKRRLENEQRLKENYSQAVLAAYPSRGYSDVGYYGKGGKIGHVYPFDRNYMMSITGAVINDQTHKADYPVGNRRSKGKRKGMFANLKYEMGGGLPKIKSYAGGGPLDPFGKVITNKPINGVSATSITTSPIYDLRSASTMLPSNAMGGKVTNAPDGGNLVAIGKGAYIAKGDTHQQDTNGDGKTGIILKTKTGRPLAEVENNEVITKDGKVLSEQLGFAREAVKIASKGGSLDGVYARQEKFKKKNGIANTSTTKAQFGVNLNKVVPDYLRNNFDSKSMQYAQPYSKRTGNVFTDMEDQFRTAGIEQETGGGFTDSTYQRSSPSVPAKKPFNWNNANTTAGNILAKVAPYGDNYLNSKIINNMPLIPQPNLEKGVGMVTNYNAAPQLQAITDSTRAYNKSIDDNVSNSAVGNAARAAFYAKGMTEKNQVLANKENIEVGLKNQNVANLQNTYNRNLAKADNYNMLNMYRKDDQDTRRSVNNTNAFSKVTQGIVDDRNQNLDDKKIQLIAKASSMNNDAAVYQGFEQLLGSYKRLGREDELKEALSKSESGVELWNKHFPKKPTSLKK